MCKAETRMGILDPILDSKPERQLDRSRVAVQAGQRHTQKFLVYSENGSAWSLGHVWFPMGVWTSHPTSPVSLTPKQWRRTTSFCNRIELAALDPTLQVCDLLAICRPLSQQQVHVSTKGNLVLLSLALITNFMTHVLLLFHFPAMLQVSWLAYCCLQKLEATKMSMSTELLERKEFQHETLVHMTQPCLWHQSMFAHNSNIH